MNPLPPVALTPQQQLGLAVPEKGEACVVDVKAFFGG